MQQTRTFVIRALIALAIAHGAAAQTAPTTVISPSPILQFWDLNGKPLAGGQVCVYAAGTTTPVTLYKDAAGMMPWGNPIVLDSSGRAVAYAPGVALKYVLRVKGSPNNCASGNTLYSVDNIQDSGLRLRSDLAGPNGGDNIGFQQPGGIVITVEDTLNKTPLATQYASFSAAVNAMSAGQTLEVPPGAYPVSAPLSITGIHIACQPGATITASAIITFGSGMSMSHCGVKLADSSPVNYPIEIAALASGITLQDVSIDCNRGNNSTPGLFVGCINGRAGGSNFFADHLAMINVNSVGILIYGTEAVPFTNITIKNSYFDSGGILIQWAANGIITGNTVDNRASSSPTATYANGGIAICCDYNDVEGNKVWISRGPTSIALVPFALDLPSPPATISNQHGHSIFKGNFGDGGNVSNVFGLTAGGVDEIIIGNQIQNTNAGICQYEIMSAQTLADNTTGRGPQNYTFIGNTGLNSPTDAGVCFHPNGTNPAYAAANNRLADNLFVGVNGGIVLSGESHNIVVENNQIINDLSASGAVITGNDTWDSLFHGNLISGSVGYAFSLGNDPAISTNNQILDNRLLNNTKGWLLYLGGKSVIRGNTVSGNGPVNFTAANAGNAFLDNAGLLYTDFPGVNLQDDLGGSATPDLQFSPARFFQITNASATTITNLLHGNQGQVISLLCLDGNTTFSEATSNISLKTGSTLACPNTTSALSFVYRAGIWHQQ